MVRRWGVIILGILCAYFIADILAYMLVRLTGLSGPAQFIAGFVIYAVLFFAVLYIIQRLTGTVFFDFMNR